MLDSTDLNILKELNKNSRIKTSHLAQKIHLTPPAISERIRKLEETGVIERYRIEVNLEQMGFSRQIFIEVTMNTPNSDMYLQFIHRYRNSILHHYKITGDSNYLIEGAFYTKADLNKFLNELDRLATYRISDVIDELI